MKISESILLAGFLLAHLSGACNSKGRGPDVPGEQQGANAEPNLGPGGPKIEVPTTPEPVAGTTAPAVEPTPKPPEVVVVTPAPEPVIPVTQPIPVTIQAASCADIKKATPTAASGIYKIYLTLPGATVKSAVDAYCGMEEDAGGWTLILNYAHKGGTNPVLAVMTKTLPLFGADVLGADDSAKATVWGHTGNAMLKALPFTEMRFFCKSSTNVKIIHFKSKDTACKTAITEGKGNCRNLKIGFTALSRHSAGLPANLDVSDENKLDATLVDNTFGHFIADAADIMWNIRGDANQKSWECDSATNNESANTIHRVWVR